MVIVSHMTRFLCILILHQRIESTSHFDFSLIFRIALSNLLLSKGLSKIYSPKNTSPFVLKGDLSSGLECYLVCFFAFCFVTFCNRIYCSHDLIIVSRIPLKVLRNMRKLTSHYEMSAEMIVKSTLFFLFSHNFYFC